MEFAQEMWRQLGDALLMLVLNPFYYIGLILVALLYRRQILLERRLFAVRLHRAIREFWRVVLWGWIGGLAVSATVLGTGLVLNMSTVIWIWALTLILLLIRIRFACLAYAAGIIGILHAGVSWLPFLADIQVVQPLISSLNEIHPPSLFALVALLHGVEALLIRLHGTRTATPLFIEGKRGKIVGAYQLQGFWAVPLFLMVPMSGGGSSLAAPWPMFFGGSEWLAGWSILAFPVLIGFTQMTISELPEHNARRTAKTLFGFAVVMGALSVVTEVWPEVIIAAGIASILIHEGMILFAKRREMKLQPYFVHGNKGLKVLAVIPDSPAAEMGIVGGEVVLKVNGYSVSTKEDLYAALQTNSAFCKLEVLNREGRSKFVQRALFHGGHHQLGLILCPDDRVSFYTEWRSVTLLSLITAKWKRRPSSAAHAPDSSA